MWCTSLSKYQKNLETRDFQKTRPLCLSRSNLRHLNKYDSHTAVWSPSLTSQKDSCFTVWTMGFLDVSNQTRFTQKMPMESFPLLYFHQPTEWPRKKTGCNCSGPGVQSHSHSQVWEVADDIHVGGVHRSFNFQAGRGMCAVVGSVGFFPPGGDLQGLAVKPHGMSVYVSKVCYPPAN